MEKSSSLSEMFINIITTPDNTFDAIKIRSRFMLLLLLISFGLAGMLIIYYSQVDGSWLSGYLISLSGEELAPDQIAQAAKFMTPRNLMIGSAIGAILGIPFIIAVQSLYLMIVGNIRNLDVSYSEWFALSVWSSTPTLFVILLMAGNLSMGDNSQLPPELINPVNFASLLGFEGPGKVYNWLAQNSIFTLWGLYLLTAGFRRWSKDSWLTAILIVNTPIAIIWAYQIY